MEPSKRVNNTSDHISRPENDHQPEKSPDEIIGVGRSYECTFCKRGFTNAQALGGHMNIHRKDKAKAKQKSNQDGPSKANDQNYANLRYFPQIPSSDHQQEMGYYRPIRGHEVNYQVYLPPANPNFQTENYFPDWRPDNFEGHLDANLNLSIGPSPLEGGDGEIDVKKNEVDLELRLGHIDR